MERNQPAIPSASSSSWDAKLNRPRPPRGYPPDLRVLLGEKPLVTLVLDAVQHVCDGSLGLKPLPSGLSPRMMLTLTSYCHASGVLGSRHIEIAIRDNRMVRYICANTFPTDRDLRKFRRDNRDRIHQCLRFVFQRVWPLELAHAHVQPFGHGGYDSDRVRDIDQEIRQRIDVASFIDMIESED